MRRCDERICDERRCVVKGVWCMIMKVVLCEGAYMILYYIYARLYMRESRGGSPTTTLSQDKG